MRRFSPAKLDRLFDRATSYMYIYIYIWKSDRGKKLAINVERVSPFSEDTGEKNDEIFNGFGARP